MCRPWGTRLLVSLILLSATSSSLRAEIARGQLLVQPIVGMATPLGHLKEFAKSGYTVGVSLQYMMTDRLAAGMDIGGTRFRVTSQKREDPSGQVWHSTFTRRLLYGVAGVRYFITRKTRANPYLEMGGGLYWADFNENFYEGEYGWFTYFQDRNANRVVPVIMFGGGLDSELNRMTRATMGVQYRLINDPQSSGFLGYWNFHVGLSFQFRPAHSLD
ncbi:MAG: hypothetical protein HZB43_03740 [candidate division Zixibacteria bacterium]|nr:hypothetical protein [candidate division Zixibacteria bacterium]